MSLQVRVPTLHDLEALVALEQRSYPAAEAASSASFAFRLAEAPDCWIVGELAGQLAGLVCGTRITSSRLTHASMSTHDPAGPNLCIHSVVIDAPFRRRGLGLELMRAYLRHVDTLTDLRLVSLIAKQHLVGFYQAAGFELLGPSDVVHGADPWFELQRPVPQATP